MELFLKRRPGVDRLLHRVIFFVWTEEKGGFGMSYIILITAHAM